MCVASVCFSLASHIDIPQTELIDSYVKTPRADIAQSLAQSNADRNTIGFSNATFSWAAQSTSRLSHRNFRLRIDGDLFFQKGKINLIVGPTGMHVTLSLRQTRLIFNRLKRFWQDVHSHGPSWGNALPASWPQLVVQPAKRRGYSVLCAGGLGSE